MEPDPTGLEAGLNPYSYCGNNPVSCVDPTGLYGSIADGTYVPDFSFNTGGFALEQQRTLEQAASRYSTSFDLLGTLFPRTMSNFARDPGYASALNQSANLRQITTAGASVAALAPYPSALIGTGILGASAPVVGAYSTVKAAAIGGLVGSGINAYTQFSDGATASTFNVQQNLGVAAVSALTSVYGTSLANGAMVVPPSLMKLGTLANPVGFGIFFNQFALTQAGSRAVKSGTSR